MRPLLLCVLSPPARQSAPLVAQQRHAAAPPIAGAGGRVAAVPRHADADRRRPRRSPPRSRCSGPTQLGDIIESSAAIANGVVYVGGGDGDLVALDLASGQAALEIHDRQSHRRIVARRGSDAGVRRRSRPGSSTPCASRDGTRRWTFKTGSEIKSSPVIVGDMVLIGSYDTHLYALDARTGAAALEGA